MGQADDSAAFNLGRRPGLIRKSLEKRPWGGDGAPAGPFSPRCNELCAPRHLSNRSRGTSLSEVGFGRHK